MVNFKNVTPGGYAQYVEIDLGTARIMVISGQVAIDAEGKVIGKGDFELQAESIFIAIKSLLEKAGGTTANLIKLNTYLTDLSDLPLFKKIRDRYINTLNPPASTTIQISRLVKDELLLEIEATAVIPA